jgi:hypothetical protein
MPSATCNPVRDRILYDAIQKLEGPVTFEATVAALPPDFDLDEMEFNGAVKILHVAPQSGRALMIAENPNGHRLAPEPVEPSTEIVDAQPIENQAVTLVEGSVPGEQTPEPVEAEPLTSQQAHDAVLEAHNALGNARLALRRAQENTKAARAANANAITIWQTGLPVYTAERNVRDHLKAEQAARRQDVSGSSVAGQTRPRLPADPTWTAPPNTAATIHRKGRLDPVCSTARTVVHLAPLQNSK